MMRSSFRISAPSKTFLCGEYAVLNGGSALVMTHEPRFQLSFQTSRDEVVAPFHPQSPAGQWMRLNAERLSRIEMTFEDPFHGGGGFGASSAQFIFVYALAMQLNDSACGLNLASNWDVRAMWDSFRKLQKGQENLPSGADVVAQWMGQVTVFRSAPWQLEAKSWPFSNLSVLLIQTGQKLATHEHLRERLPVSEALMKMADASSEAFLRGQETEFVKCIRQYGDELERLQLVAAHTRGLIAQLASLPDVLAVKGCGAMGADVVLVLTAKQSAASLRGRLQQSGLKVVASESDISSGLEFKLNVADAFGVGPSL